MNYSETKDYKMFKRHPFQRELDNHNIQRLVNSFKEHGYIKGRPILVNQDMVVFDGHHRLAAAEIAQVPVSFIVQPDLETNDIIQLNEQLSWSGRDYLDFWVKNGNENYIRFKKITEKYHVSSNCFVRILTTDKQKINRDFRMGKLEFSQTEYEMACLIFDKIDEIIAMFKNWISGVEINQLKTTPFLISLYRFLKDDRVDLKAFKEKIESCFTSLKKLSRIGDYYQQWYDIYNYRLRNKLDPL